MKLQTRLSKELKTAKKIIPILEWRDFWRKDRREQTRQLVAQVHMSRIMNLEMEIRKEDNKAERYRKLLNSLQKPKQYTTASGTVYIEHEIPLKTHSKNRFKKTIKFIVNDFAATNGKNFNIQIIWEYQKDNGQIATCSTKFTLFSQAKKEVNALIKQMEAKYDSVFNCRGLTIKLGSNDKVLGRGSSEQDIENYKEWTIIGNTTVSNCLYQSYFICEFEGVPKNVVQLAVDLKRRINPKNKICAGYPEIQEISRRKKRDIVLHDKNDPNLIMHEFKTTIVDKYKTQQRETIHIAYDGGHYYGMTKNKNPVIENQSFLNRQERRQEIKRTGQKIEKKFKENSFNNNFGTWDIEASIDADRNFKSYAVGFSFDGSEENYKSFWGSNDLQEFSDYIYEHRKELNGKVMYAHNSGKFDILLLMSEVLLTSDNWHLDTQSSMGCLELNGRWLNVTLISNDKCEIHFRDSCALLSGKLDDLTKDFNVAHKKLTDEVDHDLITLDNWHTFPELPKYLMHDVLGLYEVVKQFSLDVYEATSFAMTSRERFVKNLLEHATNLTWEKKRPAWLKTDAGKILELDCFSEQLQMAVEYNGDQHYKLCRFNKNDPKILQEQQDNDKQKAELCQKNNVKLLVIPFWLKKEQIVEAISKFLNKSIDVSNIESLDKRQTCINVTDCLTGASLAKKFFFSKYYKQLQMPVYTLEDDTDQYIRSGYFGGRVEIFHYRECTTNKKFFYYDFTSLFPAMALKLLPYSAPEYIAGKDIDINNFFGFIKCKVTTLRKDIKPLHGVLENGKLLFRHLKSREIVLFSEEIKLGMQNKQYHYEFESGYEFKSGYVMKEMSKEVFKLKADAKEQGKDALSLVWKIILNSSYGFWGLRTHAREGVKIFPRGEAPVRSYMDGGQLKSESDIGNYTLLRVLNDLNITDFNVAIASAITSYARCELWNLINTIEEKGHQVYLCDTDSVICNLDLNDYPDMKERFQWDGCGDELGTLKNELNSDVLKRDSKIKQLIREGKIEDRNKIKFRELTEEEHNDVKYGVNLFYDHGMFNGAKYYAIKSDEWGCETAKCKGFAKTPQYKLKYEGFDQTLKQDVKQFVCGLSGYLNDEAPFKINLRKVHKEISPLYNKGVVNEADGSIRPYDVDEKSK